MLKGCLIALIAILIKYLYETITGKHSEEEVPHENTEISHESKVIDTISEIERAPKDDATVVKTNKPDLAVSFVYAEPEVVDKNKWRCPECHATMAPRIKCWRCGAIFERQ